MRPYYFAFCPFARKELFLKGGPNFSYPSNFSLETTLFCQIGRKTQLHDMDSIWAFKNSGELSQKYSILCSASIFQNSVPKMLSHKKAIK